MDTKVVKEKIDAIESEMKKIGMWQDGTLPVTAYEFKEAFGVDTMSFSQWLQFVFIPQVKKLLEKNGPWPDTSEVGTYATQQYLFFRSAENGTVTTEGSKDQKELTLVKLLQEFDSLFTV